MNKQQFVVEILKFFDELDAANRRNERLGNDLSALMSSNEYSPVEALCLEVGRKTLWNECSATWCRHATATRNEDGSTSVMPYSEWIKRIHIKTPDEVSKRDFLSYFEPEYKERYEEECIEALAELEGNDER